MAAKAPPAKAARQLAELYRHNGYVRYQNAKRLKEDGYADYKKGDEVRLVLATKADLANARRLLKAVGLKPGRPFAKARQICLPIYGREQVARFLELVGE